MPSIVLGSGVDIDVNKTEISASLDLYSKEK